ncbi:nucleotidyltransferase [Dielma fastidiosa]|uniref:nucleotidyltransferase n=1 Tax=Dielma fastidiosa TaxID=1034346 RepID=UPI00356A82F9
MKITGIIAEYNPFHNGHIHHINKTKEITGCDLLICTMSGHFVQRGEPAITTKWERAKTAIENGVDLVLELPFVYAAQSAAYFAKGAVDVLKLAGVDSICFGSESNNLEILEQLAELDVNLSDAMKGGLSPVQAYEILYGSLNANDILALNYIRALQGSGIRPYSIQRTNHYHELDTSKQIASATAIRYAIKNQLDIKHATCMEITDPVFLEDYYRYFQTVLLTMDSSALPSYFMMDEGIENLLIKHARLPEFEDFISAVTSRRYTRSKIQRTMLHLMMQTKKADIDNLPPLNYLRVLACNEKGRAHLKALKEQGVHIASKFTQIPEAYRTIEYKSSVLYGYPCSDEKRQQILERELKAPVIL